jgi:CheY-like chemotaxis protein
MRKINCTLLVDDDQITNFINRRLINKLDLAEKVATVTNGEEALEYVKDYCMLNNECCPDLILLDINMPVMNGLEFLKEYNNLEFENKRKVLVVMLSTSNNPKDLEKVQGFNVDDFISKPLTEEKLLTVIDKHFK